MLLLIIRKLTLFVFFILLACSKDAPPDAVVPTPSVTKLTLSVTVSEGGTVSNPGGLQNSISPFS